MEVFGDVLFKEGKDISFKNLKRLLEMPFIKPRYRLSVLTPDELVDYVIDEHDIIENSISYTENY